MYVSSDDQEIVLALARSPDDGGLPITDYELHVNDGLLGSEFTKIEEYIYETHGFSYTVDAAALTSGRIYQFKYIAYNALGFSEFSNEALIGLGPLPSSPTGL